VELKEYTWEVVTKLFKEVRIQFSYKKFMCGVKPIYMEYCHTNFVITSPNTYNKVMCGLTRL